MHSKGLFTGNEAKVWPCRAKPLIETRDPHWPVASANEIHENTQKYSAAEPIHAACDITAIWRRGSERESYKRRYI